MHLIRFGLLLTLIVAPSAALAQTPTPPQAPGTQGSLLNQASAALHAELAGEERARWSQTRSGQRDTLANGLIIGAVIGGTAAALFGGFLCHALHEPGNPPCWRPVLTISALGAGIGAAAGAGVDALMSRNRSIFSVKARF